MNKKIFFTVLVLLMAYTIAVYAQSTTDLDAVCAAGTVNPGGEFACAAVSAQVSSAVSASAPSGVSASCSWTGSTCVLILVVPSSMGEHNTTASTISEACANGNSAEEICTNISNMINSQGATPLGVTISCVWNNPGASNACSERVVLSTSRITDGLVGNGFIKTMIFIQNGASTTSVIVRSNPFVEYYVHTVINGTNFPGNKDSEVWMHVTGAVDVTPTQFDFEQIDPAQMAAAEKSKLEAKFASTGQVELGPGVGPDFTALKRIQTFTWNMSIPYDGAKNFSGIANCNGTYNESADQCQNAGSEADWIKLPVCSTTPCASGTYKKDVPSAGYITVYSADPVPVYKSTSTTTTTTSSTTTTTAGECPLAGDNPPCGNVILSEVISHINKWVAGQASLNSVVQLINSWSSNP